jgi:epoxide hydrolase-like predicted phosphatase
MTVFKAIIFDLGKVVFDLSFDRVFQSWANYSGKPFEEIKSNFLFDELFDMFEKNEISPKQFRLSVSQRLGINISDKDFDNAWCNLYLDKYPSIDNLLIGLKSKYKIVALTNTNEIHNLVWRNKYANTLKHFEKIFSSHEMGTRKPEEKSYRIVLNYLNCEPSETIFLDDNLVNIKGAKNIGISTILVNSFDQMKNELHQFGIII